MAPGYPARYNQRPRHGRARTEGEEMTSPLTAAERELRDQELKSAKRAEARAAMADQAARATAFNDNRERLKSARLAREAEMKAKLT
jgi:hypothetical protein